ncbi:MAG: hypothetical protein LBC63_04600 [Holophagales bacterium]|nr:hypothetical protein [Holophagales bacterium]
MKAFLLSLSLIAVFAIPHFAQSSTAPWAWFLKPNESALLIYFGIEGDEALREIRSSLHSVELAPMNLRLVTQGPAPTEYGSTDVFRHELRLKPGSVWALANRKGILLAQGEAAPSIQTLAKVLEEDKISSPIKVIKDFIKSNPDHLDAKSELLLLLRKYAIARTIDVLELSVKIDEVLPMDINAHSELHYKLLSQRAKFDFAPFQGKQLEDGDDTEIWGEYAREVEYLFRTGEWRLTFLKNYYGNVPAEICSPKMKSLYRRLLPQVEQALRERPSTYLSDDDHWQTYVWMRSIAGADGSIKSVLDSMVPVPTKKTDWPPESVFSLFEQEAREQGRWGNYAEVLWGKLDEVIYDQINYAMRNNERRNSDFFSRFLGDFLLVQRDIIDPLMESLIKVSRIEDAEKVIMSFARLPRFRDLPKHAAEIAEKYGRADLASRWANLQVKPKPNEKNLEDLESVLYFGTRNKYSPTLFLINGNNPGSQYIVGSNISLGDIIDKATGLDGWEIDVTILDKDMSDLMLKRENWYGGEDRWALVNNQLKVIASGTDIPTKDILVNALEIARVEKATDKLRQFIKEHPDHVEAKEELARWLKKDATAKTSEIFQKSQDSGKTTLTSEEDYKIWNEYATLFRQLANYYFDNVPNTVTYVDAFQNDEVMRRSPTMAASAKELLPIFAANIARLPTEGEFWTMWVRLMDPQSNTQYASLMETVKPQPFTSDQVPPLGFLRTLANRYKWNNNWQGIVNIFGDFLESQQLEAGSPGYRFQRYFLHIVDSMLLLEAYMNLGQERKINELLKIWKQSEDWKADEPEIQKLFKNYGKAM